MPEPAWKKHERRTAKKIGTNRNPLSGGASRHTRSDTLHDKLYIECKHAKRIAVVNLMHGVEVKAKKEKKIPVIVLHHTGEHFSYWLIREDKLKDICKEVINGDA